MLVTEKSLSLPRILALGTFGELLIVFSTNADLLYLLLLSSASDKPKLFFLKTFLETLILMTQAFLYLFFFSKPNLKLHIISVTSMLVKKVISYLNLSKTSGPDIVLVVVLSNCEAELFNIYLKESCFPDCWKFSSVVPIFKNVGESCATKIYRPVSLLSVVSKVYEKLVNNRSFDQLEKHGFFSDFQYGFRSSRSTSDLVRVVSDRNV